MGICFTETAPSPRSTNDISSQPRNTSRATMNALNAALPIATHEPPRLLDARRIGLDCGPGPAAWVSADAAPNSSYQYPARLEAGVCVSGKWYEVRPLHRRRRRFG